MADIFSREIQYGGSSSADGAFVTFSDFGVGMLLQQMQYLYRQMVKRYYELGSSLVYLVVGRTEGVAQLTRLVGPTKLVPAFYTQFGDVCNMSSNHLSVTMKSGCGATTALGSSIVTLRNVFLSEVGGQIEAAEMTIAETLKLEFLSMTIS